MNAIREYELVIIGRPGSVSFASKIIDSARIALDALNHKIGSHAGFQHANMFEVISEDGNALSLCATFERYTPTAWRVVDDWRMKQAPIHWKSAARAFFRRAEAKQRHLDNMLEDTALTRDEMREESFDSWQDAARHWYEVTKRERASLARERLKNAALSQKLENAANATQGLYDDLNVLSERHRQERVKNAELLQETERLRETIDRHDRALVSVSVALTRAGIPDHEPYPFDKSADDYERVLRAGGRMLGHVERIDRVARERDELLQKIEELSAQPSGNPGDFAALAERIAFADGKHPRDLPDGRHTHENVALIQLQLARETLAALPTWRNAITCEFNEAMYELARGDMDRFADELLDLETVSFRARRAVLERGKE